MKKIGLVGGISWSSTIDYYRYINEKINKRLGSLNFAECIIYSVNFEKFRTFNANHDWQATRQLLAEAVANLKKAGADCILLCANTAHIVALQIKENLDLPLIDIRDATANAIRKNNIKKAALLGTVYTMELDFYKDKLKKHGIEPIIPQNKKDRDFIEQTLLHELGKGIIKEDTKKEYLRIAGDCIKEGAEGVILGCTEIPLILNQNDFTIPVFDTTRIHAQAAVDFALSGHQSTIP